MKPILFHIGALILVLSSCCKALPPTIDLIIQDENGNNLITQPTDSSWNWSHPEQVEFVKPIEVTSQQEGNILSISSDGFQSGQDYYFYSTNGDVDTINIIYKSTGFNCKLSTKVEKIVYNGTSYQGSRKDIIYTLIKK